MEFWEGIAMNDVTTSGTSRAKPSALPDAWIDRLFLRFSQMYGKLWLDMWEHIPMDGVKATWAEDLAGCSADQIRHALDHCKTHLKFPPTCPEFVALCREFREKPQNVAYLPAPVSRMPPHVAEQLRAFVEGKRQGDCRDWARKILANPKEYPWISKQMAEEALGVAGDAR
jgi:hypothetical protein